MADTDGAVRGQNPEAPEELGDDQQAWRHFSAYSESRRALPWEQWTFREKANYYVDRIFLGILSIFIIMLVGEFGYKMWYVTNVSKVVEFLSDSVVFVFDLLFTQERQGELAEL